MKTPRRHRRDRKLTVSDALLLYRATNGAVYKISILALWTSRFDFRRASDEEIKIKRREVHVVESALAEARGFTPMKFAGPLSLTFPPPPPTCSHATWLTPCPPTRQSATSSTP